MNNDNGSPYDDTINAVVLSIAVILAFVPVIVLYLLTR